MAGARSEIRNRTIHLAEPQKLDRIIGHGLIWRPMRITFTSQEGVAMIFAHGVHIHFGTLLNGAIEILTQADSKRMIRTAGIRKIETFPQVPKRQHKHTGR